MISTPIFTLRPEDHDAEFAKAAMRIRVLEELYRNNLRILTAQNVSQLVWAEHLKHLDSEIELVPKFVDVKGVK